MTKNNTINYIELQSTDLKRTKDFYSKAFGWEFTDYGPTYMGFSGSGINGGFEQVSEVHKGGALIVLYHADLAVAQKAVEDAGGKISVPIFSFPGGQRFQFIDNSGNELAVWVKG